MELLENAIINWVSFSQVNQNKLSRPCSSIYDLSDGVLLLEILSVVSLEYFDVNKITLQTDNNWALSLGNLKFLKRAIDTYFTDILKIPYERVSNLVLADIARRRNPEDIFKLLKQVFLLILNCQKKSHFIEKITKLSEPNQVSLMGFIKSVMGEENSDSFSETTTEVETLRNSNNLLISQLEKIQSELTSAVQKKEELQRANEELKMKNINIENEYKTITCVEAGPDLQMYHKMEKKLNEESSMIEAMKNIMGQAKKNYEKEINLLKDELDSAKVSLHKLHKFKVTSEKLKKKNENLQKLKEKFRDLEKKNDMLHQTIANHQHETAVYRKRKHKMISVKEELRKEQELSEKMRKIIEVKEQLLVKSMKTIKKMKEKQNNLENYIMELKMSASNSIVSEDSNVTNKGDLESEIRRKYLDSKALNPGIHHSGQFDMLSNDFQRDKEEILLKKSKIQQLKEIVAMQNEEISTRIFIDSQKISDLTCWNQEMTEKIQVLSEEIANYEIEKQNCKHDRYELDSLRHSNEDLLQQVKENYTEKNDLLNRCIEARNESLEYLDKMTQTQQENQELIQKLHLAHEKLATFETSHEKTENSADPEELLKLKLENSRLIANIAELKSSSCNLHQEKKKHVKLLEIKHKEIIEKMQNEMAKTEEMMIKDADSAQKKFSYDRHILQSRLDVEKKNFTMKWNKGNLPQSLQSEEVKLLKFQLAAALKENDALARDKQEVTLCWKDSHKMLKELEKAMRNEALKMQTVIKQRKSGCNQ